jgi:hypothetical protein
MARYRASALVEKLFAAFRVPFVASRRRLGKLRVFQRDFLLALVQLDVFRENRTITEIRI